MQVPDEAIERMFRCELQSLESIFEFACQSCAAGGFPAGTELDVQLVLEELVTNMMKYDRGGTPEIGVRLRGRGDHIEITVWHDDVEPFDPTRVPEADPAEGVSLAPGGRGIGLVRKLVEEFTYDYTNRRSTVRATLRPRTA
jgi:anti-sigma regulatory factor (Ser/Thr protein kinase)